MANDIPLSRASMFERIFRAQCVTLNETFMALSVMEADHSLRPQIEETRARAEAEALKWAGRIVPIPSDIAAIVFSGSPDLLAAMPVQRRRAIINFPVDALEFFRHAGPDYARGALTHAGCEAGIATVALRLAQRQPVWRPLLAHLALSPHVLHEARKIWSDIGITREISDAMRGHPDVLPRTLALHLAADPALGGQIASGYLTESAFSEYGMRNAIESLRVLQACGADLRRQSRGFRAFSDWLPSNHLRMHLETPCPDVARLAAQPLCKEDTHSVPGGALAVTCG